MLPGSSTRGGSQPTGKGKATTGNTADAEQKPLLTVPATSAHSTVRVVLSAGVIGAGCAGRRLFENPAGVVDPSAPDPRKARRCGDASIWISSHVRAVVAAQRSGPSHRTRHDLLTAAADPSKEVLLLEP